LARSERPRPRGQRARCAVGAHSGAAGRNITPPSTLVAGPTGRRPAPNAINAPGRILVATGDVLVETGNVFSARPVVHFAWSRVHPGPTSRLFRAEGGLFPGRAGLPRTERGKALTARPARGPLRRQCSRPTRGPPERMGHGATPAIARGAGTAPCQESSSASAAGRPPGASPVPHRRTPAWSTSLARTLLRKWQRTSDPEPTILPSPIWRTHHQIHCMW
jgi:hypothetical protein